MGDLKFYSDVDCTNEISNGVAMSSKPWSGHSAEEAFDGMPQCLSKNSFFLANYEAKLGCFKLKYSTLKVLLGS